MRARAEFLQAKQLFNEKQYHLAYVLFEQEREYSGALVCEAWMLKCQFEARAIPVTDLYVRIQSWSARLRSDVLGAAKLEMLVVIRDLKLIAASYGQGQNVNRANYMLDSARAASLHVNHDSFPEFSRIMEIEENDFSKRVESLFFAMMNVDAAKQFLNAELHFEVDSLIACMQEDIGDIYIDAFTSLQGAPLSIKKELYELAKRAYEEAIAKRVQRHLPASAMLQLAHLNTLQELFAIAKAQQNKEAEINLHKMIHRILFQGQIDRLIPLEESVDVRWEVEDEMRKYHDWYTEIMRSLSQADQAFIRFLRVERAAALPQPFHLRSGPVALWDMWIDDLLAEQPLKKRYRDETRIDLRQLVDDQPQRKRARVSQMGLLSQQSSPTQGSTSPSSDRSTELFRMLASQ